MRGQAGRIEFFWEKSFHLTTFERRRFFEPCLEGIRASKEHICVYMQLFLRCILIEGASALHEANSFTRTAYQAERSRNQFLVLGAKNEMS